MHHCVCDGATGKLLFQCRFCVRMILHRCSTVKASLSEQVLHVGSNISSIYVASYTVSAPHLCIHRLQAEPEVFSFTMHVLVAVQNLCAWNPAQFQCHKCKFIGCSAVFTILNVFNPGQKRRCSHSHTQASVQVLSCRILHRFSAVHASL